MAPKFVNNVEVLRTDTYVLHHIPSIEPTDGLPVFVVPPHAGRHGCIAQRMADTCSIHRPTYVMELLPATCRNKGTDVQGLVQILFDCQSYINEVHNTTMVDLVCLCQGAWLGAIYAAKYPHRVARYANFAGPINTKTGAKPNKMEDYCNTMSMEYHKMVVALNNGIQPGLFQWFSFSLVSPAEVYFGRWFDLAWGIYDGDKKKCKKLRRNNEWYDHPIDLDGLWFLECLENHFKDNKLYLGSWIIGNEPVDLSKITCDVFLYGGEDDIITHPEQVFGLADVISSKNVKKTTFPKAGHTKVFVGTNELKQFVGDFF